MTDHTPPPESSEGETDAVPLSAVIVARDEAGLVAGCISRLGFAGEVLVAVDSRSTDNTAVVAAQAGARVETITFETFAEARTKAMAMARGRWILFVDADERVPAALAEEITRATSGPPAAYRLRIENWFYGGRIRNSGYREAPIRLFPASHVTRYSGAIHEQPDLPPDLEVRSLQGGLAHFSHRSVIDNLRKTAAYADVQAREMLEAGHRPVTRLTLVAVLLRTLFRHLVVGMSLRDGMPGFIESLYQPLSIFCVYARLWELQQSPSIDARYDRLEETTR